MKLERFTQPAIGDFARRFNVAHGQAVAATLATTIGGELRALRWGVLAPWRGHGGKRPPPIYVADADASARPPVLRKARPCLVPADGFYAYAAHTAGGKRVPYWLHAADGAAFAFAGLAATHADDGVESFALILAPAPSALAAITPLAFATEPREIHWRATAISKYFADASHDDPRCIAPLGNPAQGELF